MTDFLSGAVSEGEIFQQTTYRSLYFIGCGIRRPDSPELLNAARMAELFAHVRANFAAIIVDTPPLGAGVDAFALATVTGHLVLVLRPGMANRGLVETKLSILQRLPVRLLGAVLNDVQEGREYAGYSYYLAGYEATEEALYNSLFMATTTTSNGHTVQALPLDKVREILTKYRVVDR